MHLYDTAGQGTKLAQFAHAAPVLNCCFGENDNELFSSGLDWSVNQWVAPQFSHSPTGGDPQQHVA